MDAISRPGFESRTLKGRAVELGQAGRLGLQLPLTLGCETWVRAVSRLAVTEVVVQQDRALGRLQGKPYAALSLHVPKACNPGRGPRVPRWGVGPLGFLEEERKNFPLYVSFLQLRAGSLQCTRVCTRVCSHDSITPGRKGPAAAQRQNPVY